MSAEEAMANYERHYAEQVADEQKGECIPVEPCKCPANWNHGLYVERKDEDA